METQPPAEKRFIFQGTAVALAAHIRRPNDSFVPAVASSCLPVTGGLAEARVPAQRFGDRISFESAFSRAQGDFADLHRAAELTHGNHGENELPTNTFVEVGLSGLRIAIPQPAGAARILEAKTLHARLESTADRVNPVSFRSLEATFDGISIDGKILKVNTAPECFSRNETKDKLLKALESSEFRKQYFHLFYPFVEEQHSLLGGLLGGLSGKHEAPHTKGPLYATVVSGISWQEKPPERPTRIQGNRLSIDGLGTLYFGEIFIDDNARRLTLLRFQLGSPDGGDGSACELQSNGGGWPPA
jgi:hypothetical protein